MSPRTDDVLALLEGHPDLGSAELIERVQDVRRTLASTSLDFSGSGGRPKT